MSGELAKINSKHTDEEKLRAAYALNMCTVSVSQIVDYHDSYILEQEYDAILNNLNLKQIPKDEALLRILTELLNTITFFRIQKIKKQQIEKKYNQRVKNAIWSAVPSLSVVVSGNPIAIVFSLATQIGTGYMNYRKEKNNAKADKEDSEIELEITAIEQFNALKRELFTTAWRLADEYDFEDEWRLTEKQIAQYNEILMDSDELRKYARLESIASKFVAYPPFWYFYGHTANYIAEMAKNRMHDNKQESESEKNEYYKDQALFKQYIALAKEHYEHFYKLCDYNILREDQLTASFALEYLDVLWNDGERDIDKLKQLIKLAEKMSPTAFDTIQLCAISYLKIGETDEAARLLKRLVNEEYNLSANAKLLSRIYVSKYLFGNKKESNNAMAEYRFLEKTVELSYLFPMPLAKKENSKEEDSILQNRFVKEQKDLLQKNYQFVINKFIKAQIIEYNKIWPIPYTARNVNEEYFDYSVESSDRRRTDVEKAFNGERKKEFVNALRDSSFRTKYLDLLNDVLCSLDELTVFREYNDKDDLVRCIRKKIVLTRNKLKDFQNKLKSGTFGFKDYSEMQDVMSFRTFTEEFFDRLKMALMDQLDDVEIVSGELGETPMKYFEIAELELIDFCRKHHIPEPEETYKNNSEVLEESKNNYYLEYSIWGSDIDDEMYKNKQREQMRIVVKESADSLISGSKKDVAVLLPQTEEFESYFKNTKLKSEGLKAIVLAIIDDRTRKDYDLILTYNGFVIVDRNVIQSVRDYHRVHYIKLGTGDELEIGWPDKYTNKNVNMYALYSVIQKLCEIKDKDGRGNRYEQKR